MGDSPDPSLGGSEAGKNVYFQKIYLYFISQDHLGQEQSVEIMK